MIDVIKKIYSDRMTSKVTYQPESRKRVRVIVDIAGKSGFKPGDKVFVESQTPGVVSVSKSRKQTSLYSHSYTVEKDGAVRFPAHRFGLSANEVVTLTNIGNPKTVVVV